MTANNNTGQFSDTPLVLDENCEIVSKPKIAKNAYQGKTANIFIGKTMTILGEKISPLTHLMQCSRPERWLIVELLQTRNYKTNIALLRKEKTSTETQYLRKAYKSLVEKQILVRVRPHTYMLNPSLIAIKADKDELVSIKKSWELYLIKAQEKLK